MKRKSTAILMGPDKKCELIKKAFKTSSVFLAIHIKNSKTDLYVINTSVQNIKTEEKFLYFVPHFLCSSLQLIAITKTGRWEKKEVGNQRYMLRWTQCNYECQLTGEMQGRYSTWQPNTEDFCSKSGKTVEEQSGVTCRQRKEEKNETCEARVEKKCMAPEIRECSRTISD